jgi:hypothetical protein
MMEVLRAVAGERDVDHSVDPVDNLLAQVNRRIRGAQPFPLFLTAECA